jgi:hypothetical protein
MDNDVSRRIRAALIQRVGADANSATIADAIVAIWREIDAALIPVIGHRGTAALYKRSLYLTAAAHPYLGGMHEGVHTAADPASLASVLAQQSSTVAAAGGAAFLQTFHELLATLVGPSLTERLLRSVWGAGSLSDRTAQDHSL